MRNSNLIRPAIFLFVALLHGVVLFYWVIYIKPALNEPEPPLTVMKLVDIQEELPPPPLPPPPPPAEPPPAPAENVVETIAENMTVVEEVPEKQTLVAPGTVTAPVTVPSPERETYLPQNKITKMPFFSEEAIREVLIYPPIAQRSGIEGSVILELFIDRDGVVQRVIVLKETPPGRGFGEAAAKAFQGQRCVPAESNGTTVGVRYRYPVRFKLN
ncbi:TonB family protein [Treponema sp. TIM-1]|uniref:energy transducer TonB n=1 Tax=Treponema sp. TIM-1 TaxID=2898417 RepID=UPI0039819046